MLVLVTGATGYVAGQLVPELISRGHRVRVLARDPKKLDGRSWAKTTETFRGDVMAEDGLVLAMQDVHTAYYLVHSMTNGPGYTDLEVVGARNFARAAASAGVQHIIYLGGLADPDQKDIGAHMRSRIDTGATLREGKVPVTEFRASVIVGSGSTSFEIIRFMTELLPIVPAPSSFLQHRAQPIAVLNVVQYLIAALEQPSVCGRHAVVEIGGPDVLTYCELMLRYARVRRHRRRIVVVSGIPTWLMALGIGLTTPVPRSVASALIASLSCDSVAKETATARALFPSVKPIDFDSAVVDALTHLHPNHLERSWDGGGGGGGGVKRCTAEGFFIEQHEARVHSTPEHIFRVLADNDYLRGYAWMWRISGWAELLLPRVAPAPGLLSSRTPAPQFTVDSLEPNRVLLVRSPIFSVAGDTWIEWRVTRNDVIASANTGATTSVKQTLFFAPRGLIGFVYWFLTTFIRRILFGSLLRVVTDRAAKLG